MTTILYIAGAGRSGSTLLDIMLGQHEAIFSCGELSNLSVSVANEELCSCSVPVGACPFWSSVMPKNLYYRHTEFQMNHSKSAGSWISVLFGHRHKQYVSYLDDIYDQVSDNSGKSIIVDSSKSPLRLAALLKYSRHSIKVIHLVRHPANVAKSLSVNFSKDKSAGVQHEIKSKGVIRSFVFWSVINLMVDISISLFSKEPALKVSFRKLLLNPGAEMHRIYSHLSVIPNSFDYENGFLNAKHIMSGNRMRMLTDIKFLKRDDITCQESFVYRVGTFVTLPLIKRYLIS